MIRGVHTMFLVGAQRSRFLRDKLRIPFTDVGGGWLIFDLPEADMGCHPPIPSRSAVGSHDISFYCDDVEATVAELRSRGVEFTDEITDRGYGLVTHFKMPGGVEVQLYQPRYEKRPARRSRSDCLRDPPGSGAGGHPFTSPSLDMPTGQPSWLNLRG